MSKTMVDLQLSAKLAFTLHVAANNAAVWYKTNIATSASFLQACRDF